MLVLSNEGPIARFRPDSKPTRQAPGARSLTVAAIASGVEGHLPCHAMWPSSSTTQT
jgi:hypothetical protein